MQLSREGTAVGDGPRTRRWTPPNAVDVEDAMDRMNATAALVYDHPPSPSARAIQMLQFYKSTILRRLA
jgi:hypothetical protein